MSGALPTSPGFTDIEVSDGNMVIVEYSESGKSEARNMGGTSLEYKLNFPPMSKAEFRPIYAFMRKQRGSYESWTFINPETATPQGIATGTPLVNGAHAAGETSITTDGWTNNTTGIVKAGDVIKFANHNKVYVIVDDANSGATTGPATLTIEPPLEEALINNEAITVTNVPTTVRLIEIEPYKTMTNGYYRYSIRCREAK